MKILITAATSANSYKLKNTFTGQEVILGDHADLPVFMQKNIVRLPDPITDTYTHEMLKLCLDLGIDKVYALTGQEAGVLLQSDQLFKEYNITIVDGTVAV